jgi:hypothetical protein
MLDLRAIQSIYFCYEANPITPASGGIFNLTLSPRGRGESSITLEASKHFQTRCEIVDSASYVLLVWCKLLAIQDATKLPLSSMATVPVAFYP